MPEVVQPDKPQAGFYQMRLVKGGPFVAVRIWWGFPTSLSEDETVDRRPAWNAEREGQPVNVDWVWPDCSGEPIPESEYRFMLARAEHDRLYQPSSPYANPRQRIDLSKAPLPVFTR